MDNLDSCVLSRIVQENHFWISRVCIEWFTLLVTLETVAIHLVGHRSQNMKSVLLFDTTGNQAPFIPVLCF